MRLGAWLAGDAPVELILSAEAAGLFGIGVDTGDLGSARAAEVAALTTDARVLVPVVLGSEHPVTLAEEVAVVDHLSAGRAVTVVRHGGLDAAAAAEDLSLLRKSWSGRTFRHEGARWTVPANINGDGLPTTLSVTPKPAQLDMPVWLDGLSSPTLPQLARSTADVDGQAQVSPGVATLSGDLDADRELVLAWSAAGATHLLVAPPSGGVDPDFFPRYVARYLQPEVAMPYFPRIMAEAELPSGWMPA